LLQDLNDRRGEATTLDSIGYAHHLLGEPEQALTYYQQSLTLNRELGGRYSQAEILSRLGDTQHATGDLEAARDAWQEALDILDHLDSGLRAGLGAGYPHPDELRAKLRGLDGSTSNEANDDADPDPKVDQSTESLMHIDESG